MIFPTLDLLGLGPDLENEAQQGQQCMDMGIRLLYVTLLLKVIF